MSDFIQWFEGISIEDVPFVGGRNGSLGEMVHELTAQGISIPNGFAVTADGYREFMKASNLDGRVREILQGLGKSDVADLQSPGKQIGHVILKAELPNGVGN
jgi:pyruvate,water dikinase